MVAILLHSITYATSTSSHIKHNIGMSFLPSTLLTHYETPQKYLISSPSINRTQKSPRSKADEETFAQFNINYANLKP